MKIRRGQIQARTVYLCKPWTENDIILRDIT